MTRALNTLNDDDPCCCRRRRRSYQKHNLNCSTNTHLLDIPPANSGRSLNNIEYKSHHDGGKSLRFAVINCIFNAYYV